MLRYNKAIQTERDFEAFKSRVAKHPRTLFVLAADEAHWGSLKDKPHDKTCQRS